MLIERENMGGEPAAFLGAAGLEELSRIVAAMPDDPVAIVYERLKAAARLIEQTGGAVMPRGVASAWPAIARTIEEIREIEAETPPEDRRPLRLPPTARQVSQAEEALFWPLYVTEARPAAALNIWMRCYALRIKSWQQEAIKRGFTKTTLWRSRKRAFQLIAVGLVRDGKPITPPER